MTSERSEIDALREALDAFGAERAPELVAEAKAEAAAKVRSMLAEAMAQSLLDHAGAHVRGAQPARPPKRPAARREPPARRAERAEAREREPTRAPDETGLYVYGVVPAGAAGELPRDLRGVDGGRGVSAVVEDGLAAVVSPVSLVEFGEEQLHDNLNDVAWLEDKARGHEEVLDAILSRSTVVPMRLCTIYRGEPQVREMLTAERATFADALDRLEGKAEWGVKLFADPGALESAARSEGSAQGDDEDEVSAGMAYLNERRRESRVREVADELADRWAAATHERLSAIAAEALLNPLQRPEVSGRSGEMLLNGVYLLDDDAVGSFGAAVEDLEREYADRGVSVELSGPWPPYNFVKGSIEAAR